MKIKEIKVISKNDKYYINEKEVTEVTSELNNLIDALLEYNVSNNKEYTISISVKNIK